MNYCSVTFWFVATIVCAMLTLLVVVSFETDWFMLDVIITCSNCLLRGYADSIE